MSKEEFLLIRELLALHEWADMQLSQGKKPIVDKDGKATHWDFIWQDYYNNGSKYICLVLYKDLFKSEIWKAAYKFLSENHFLIEHPIVKNYYIYVPLNKEYINDHLLGGHHG